MISEEKVIATAREKGKEALPDCFLVGRSFFPLAAIIPFEPFLWCLLKRGNTWAILEPLEEKFIFRGSLSFLFFLNMLSWSAKKY